MKRSLIFLLVLVAGGVAFSQGRTLGRPGSLLNRGNRPMTAPMGRTPMGRTPSPTTPAASSANKGGSEPGGRSIEFNQAPVDMVLKVYGDLVGKTILKDPGAPSPTITLQPRQGQELTDADKIEAIETVLEMNGIHMEPYGEKFIRALPRKEVRKEGIPLIMDHEAELKDSTRVVSLMLPFKNISVEDAQKALDNFKSASGIIIGFERTNALLLTDTEANINRMREIARTIDVATPVMENVYVRQIKNASAEDIKTALEAIVEDSQKELEKHGKTPANTTAASPNLSRPIGSLLRRPGQQQPQTPTPNQSLVMGISDADRGMIRGKVLILSDERSNKLIIITSKSNMDFFDKVIEALDIETTPDTLVKVYRLKYAEAEEVSDMINDLIGNSQSGKSSAKGSQNANSKKGTGGNMSSGSRQAAKKPANQRTGETKAGELTKDNTTVLADKRINGLVVMTEKELVPTIEQIIESMDIKLSQVLIETMIIEVTLGDDISTGMDWIQHGRQEVQADAKNSMGQTLYYRQREYSTTDSSGATKSWTQVFGDTVPQGYTKTSTSSDGTTTWTDTASEFVAKTSQVATDGVLNYYTGGTATAIAGGQGGEAAYNIAKGVTSNVFGKALNFVFTSDELGLTAILQATKTDSRSKYIASPVIMTLDNKEAIVEATSKQQFLTGWQAVSSSYAGSGLPSPTYTGEDIGIKIKATPKINPNGTVMLEVEEEYSKVGGTQTMKTPSGQSYIDTVVDVPATRKMSSDVLLENNQTVVFAGLTQKYTSEQEKGIPFLKDIPFVGKWLFGTVDQTETRTELLVFMTPYVLDDAQAAEAEALRRKKTVSDANAWDDNGWSLSKLADPVSKKEQMRRLKDEWKKQDAEREARLEAEKAKLERAKKLKELSIEERNLWLKMHKEDLKKEEQEKLEKALLDKESQEELRKLADKVKKAKLGAAENELDKMEKAAHQDNERAKLEAEKARAAEKARQDKLNAETEKAKAAESKAKEKVEAAKPKVEPAKPKAEPAKPKVELAKPKVEAAKPKTEAPAKAK